MRVRTLRQHSNPHKPQVVKNIGRKYELPDAEARNLIAQGIVAEDKPDDGEAV